MEFENLLSCDISLRNRRNYLSCKFNNNLLKLLLRFVQVFITFSGTIAISQSV